VLFTGEYEHTIDSKHRVSIPAEIRSRMERDDHSAAFYVVPGPNGALWLWLEETFERMADSLEQTLLPGEDMMEFDEITFPLARRVDLDSAGRIRLPEALLNEVGLGNSVVILGMRDHLEIRDPENWARERARKRARQAEIMLRARSAIRQRPTQGGGGESGA